MCLSLIYSLFRSLWRFFCALFNRFFVNRKLEDILTEKKPSKALRNQEIEQILRSYPNELVQSFNWDTGDETDAAEAILEDSISECDKRWRDLSKTLANSLRQIKGYQKLCLRVEERRLEHYHAKNTEHEAELMRLWKLLKPEEPLTDRITDQWQQIGFQGDDPATDFRGMGMLGLDQLVFFAQFDRDNCRHVLSLSHHPIIGFPFAICGITITALCKELLFDDLLKNHFYNALEQSPLSMDNFHQVYCRVFTLFADFWVFVHPASVMEFNVVKQRFVEHLERYLRRLDVNLLNTQLEDLGISPAAIGKSTD